MTFKYFILELQEHVMLVKFNRPESLNALNSKVIVELEELIKYIEESSDVHVVVFTGEGKAFVAGADIAEMSTMNFAEGKALAELGQNVFLHLEELSKPTIAAVNGYCLGGGNEFAMACDFRFASEKAKFGQPEVTLGVTPGFAGTQRLAKLTSESTAKEMIYTGGIYDAAFAHENGLVSRVYSKDELLEETMKFAHKIARNGQIAVRLSKKAINEGLEKPVCDGNKIEADYFGQTFNTEDQKNAMKAFLNKEKYKFLNK